MKVARVNDRPFATLDSLLGIGASIPPIVFPDSPSTVLQLINKSGGDVDAGDVVVINPGDDVSFTTTTNAREEISVGIAQDTIVADASGPILVEGYATLVNVQASVTRGDFLETYTVAKQADGNATRHSGSFGQFLTGGTTPLAWLWGSADASASGTITVGDGGTPVTGVDTVIFSGASVTDDTGGQVTVTVTGGSGSNLLAISQYTGSGGDVTTTTTSTTYVDVDATHMLVTFTAPASGNVLVRAYLPGLAVAGSGVFLGLRESTTNVSATILAGAASAIIPVYIPFYITGISAGSHTYKLSWHTESGIMATLYYGNTTRGPVMLEVWSA